MASTTTMSTWLEDLANSIMPTEGTAKQKRRSIELFRRRVKNHTFLRANQFDVIQRLDGLEEKFQILDRDDLSDAIYQRRAKLQRHEERWIPDVLDLLLRLSQDPARQRSWTRDVVADPLLQDLSLSNWADNYEVIDFDPEDPTWKQPNYSDMSSDEDETESTDVTNASLSNDTENLLMAEQVQASQMERMFEGLAGGVARSMILDSAFHLPDDNVTEIQVIRETLLMVQGYPTKVFALKHNNQLSLKKGITTKSLDADMLQILLNRAVTVRQAVDSVKAWTEQKTDIEYIQIIQSGANDILSSYEHFVARLLAQLCTPSPTKIVSLLWIVDQLESEARVLLSMCDFVHQVRDCDAVTTLSHLHSDLVRQSLIGDESAFKLFLPVFIRSLRVYLKPVQVWLAHGRLDSDLQPFFVTAVNRKSTMGRIWHDWYQLLDDGAYRPPDFMARYAGLIFACGKTSTFIEHIQKQASEELINDFDRIVEDLHKCASDLLLPFSATLDVLLHDCLKGLLSKKTCLLKELLDSHCSFSRTLEAFDLIYLRADGVATDYIESKIFSDLDKCLDRWNDRFLVADLLEDEYSGVDAIDLSSVIVHSVRTSSRTIESRRRSVNVLGTLVIEYVLPWPIANIIPKVATASYWRLALCLAQVRRAKYMLERLAYINVNSQPIADGPAEQKRGQLFTFMLLNLVNTLYDHFTMTVVKPATIRMRADLHSAQTVDDMISVHQKYIDEVEHACITAPNLRVLKETLIGLLDMCIRFSDLISSTAPTAFARRRSSGDIEVSSFKSARSHHRQRRKDRGRRRRNMVNVKSEQTKTSLSPTISDNDTEEETEDSDDDDLEGEGYSSFIVLDSDTSISKEIHKLQIQFKRQLEFFVAGIRGVARSGKGESRTVEQMTILADRLTWRGDRH